MSRKGFTLVELIVVMTVIVLILALAVPGLSSMNAEARMTAAVQTVNGMMTQAYYLSVAESTMTAVRFVPSEWEVADDEGGSAVGRQRVAVYKYVGTTDQDDGSGGFNVEYREYFKPAEGFSSVELPTNVWVAPLEALSDESVTLKREDPFGTYEISYNDFGPDCILDGEIGQFEYDALLGNGGGDQDAEFLNADDFLIVFDPQRGGLRSGLPKPFRLRAYSPTPPDGCGYETDGEEFNEYYQRYNFSGVIFYRREPFVALGTGAAGWDRQDYLRGSGRPYLAQRYSGGLLSGMQGQE
ncbi:MAG: prepilin-type N-terminal cleavage/methylation domain-containing protein [Phycisphaerae bacterium]|nr:prepilin-type N-terminal cleavage/methylation domain-containing protein [Phycisphaerae bacterium]